MHISSSEVMLSCYYFKVTDLSDGSISYASDKKNTLQNNFQVMFCD